MNTKLTLLATLALSAAPLFAQETVTLEPITFSADFDEIELNRTGASVEVIENEEIEKAQSLTLSEFLGQKAGVSVNRSGPIGTSSSVQIRGARQYEVKVLIDGMDVSDPSLPQSYYNFGTMGMGGIERVEIVKGSQSSLYGGSAVGGVIAITSKTADRDGFSGSGAIEYGSYNTAASSLTLGYGNENYAVAVSYSTINSDGFSAADENDGNTEADGFAGERLSINAIYDVSDSLSVGFTGFHAYSESEYDFASGDADVVGISEQFAARAFVRYETDRSKSELSVSHFDTSRNDISVHPVYGTSEGGYDSTRDTIAIKGSYNVLENLSVDYGLEHVEEEAIGNGYNLGSGGEREVNSVILGANFAPTSQIDVSLLGRYDDDSLAGEQTSYRLAVAYRPTESITLKGSAATGYRAPSLNELYSGYYGDDSLTNELTTSFDIAAEYSNAPGNVLGISLFKMETEDLIGFDYTQGYYQIDGITDRKGVEIYAKNQITDNISASLAYTYIVAEKPNGDPVGRIPENELNFAMNWDITEKWSASTDVKIVKGLEDNVVNTVIPMDDYSVVNARVGYKLGEGEIYARVENLLDEEYQTATGYGTSDRALYVGYSVGF